MHTFINPHEVYVVIICIIFNAIKQKLSDFKITFAAFCFATHQQLYAHGNINPLRKCDGKFILWYKV